ncbi:MAG: F0F1 ATP synthase subunit A, partial [Maritimibacter harenae]
MDNPLTLEPLFFLGPVPITAPVVVTWAIIAVLALVSLVATRRLSLKPGRFQTVLELFVTTIDGQVRDTMNRDPARYRALIGTLFLFILVANWSSLIPGVEPPTARLETDAALALVVFVATIGFGIVSRGIRGY